MQDKNTIDRHHLLEIILWPNGDGTFTEIRNSAERLKELGIYDDYKLTISITRAEHTALHRKGAIHSDLSNMKNRQKHLGKTATNETKRKISVALTGKKRKPFSDEHRRKLSEAKKGKPLGPMSDDTKQKLSEVNKGKTLSAEHKMKLSEAHKGNTPGNKGKHLVIIDGKRKYI